MFNRYKSKVAYCKENICLREHSQYTQRVAQIMAANKNMDEDTQVYLDIIKSFPKTRAENIRHRAVIQLKKNIAGLLTADIKVNHVKMTFLIDTGAETTVVTNKVLAALKIESKAGQKVKVGAFDGKKGDMALALVDYIGIGRAGFYNTPVLVMDSRQLSFSLLGYKLIEFDGILGWDILSQLDFIIDPKKLELTILKGTEAIGTPNLIKSSFPAVVVSDDTKELRLFGLDTGARKSWINKDLVGKSELKITHRKEEKRLGVHGIEIEIVDIIKDYRIKLYDAVITFNNIPTGFTGFLNGFEFDGVLGLDLLGDNKLKVINSKGRLFLEKNT